MLGPSPFHGVKQRCSGFSGNLVVRFLDVHDYAGRCRAGEPDCDRRECCCQGDGTHD